MQDNFLFIKTYDNHVVPFNKTLEHYESTYIQEWNFIDKYILNPFVNRKEITSLVAYTDTFLHMTLHLMNAKSTLFFDGENWVPHNPENLKDGYEHKLRGKAIYYFSFLAKDQSKNDNFGFEAFDEKGEIILNINGKYILPVDIITIPPISSKIIDSFCEFNLKNMRDNGGLNRNFLVRGYYKFNFNQYPRGKYALVPFQSSRSMMVLAEHPDKTAQMIIDEGLHKPYYDPYDTHKRILWVYEYYTVTPNGFEVTQIFEFESMPKNSRRMMSWEEIAKESKKNHIYNHPQQVILIDVSDFKID